MDKVLNQLRKIDAYPKTLEDYRVKTYMGATISILSGALILYLFVTELALFLTTDVHHEIIVDPTFGDKLQINIDVTFPNMPCAFLSLDAMDVSGEHQSDVDHNIFKKRLDRDGKSLSGFERDVLERDKPEVDVAKAQQEELPADYCGSCYGSEEYAGQCCNTCEEVREAYRKKGWAFSNVNGIEQCVREGWADMMKEQSDEGCNLSGHLKVNKVAGNFHIAPGKSFQQHHMHVHDLQIFDVKFFNMSHVINRLSFGKVYPGIVNPLDGEVQAVDHAASSMWSYYVKIVPTTYVRKDGRVIKTNQYSVTEHFQYVDHTQGSHGLPGMFVVYDISPLVVNIHEYSKSFSIFLTSVCAIIGGVYTVAGIIDSFSYQGMRTLKKKMELGKAS